MKFIADVMLGRLAKRMRLLGQDVLYSPCFDDNDILRLALEQDRMILTRDSGLAKRPLAKGCLLITSDSVDDQLRQVEERSPLTAAPFTRCSVCNTVLTVPSRSEVVDLVPEHVRDRHAEFLGCPSCGRIYWAGSHVRWLRSTKRKEGELPERSGGGSARGCGRRP